MRRHHRQAQAAGQRHGVGEERVAIWLARALQFDVIAPGEELAPAPRDPFGILGMVRKERPCQFPAEETRKRDQALGALLEPASRDERAAAVLVREPSTGKERAKPEVTGTRSAEQERPEGLITIGFILDPAIGAQDRLYAARARRAIE